MGEEKLGVAGEPESELPYPHHFPNLNVGFVRVVAMKLAI